MARSLQTNLIAKAGGVMTDEVGAVTGELTLRTELAEDGAVRVLVQYLGADEWYRVTDSATSLPVDTTLEALHANLVAALEA